MLRDKMLAIISELNDEIVERYELIMCIAIALLASLNLFILGETGQAKSYAINKFRERIKGAIQFERLLTKQSDETDLFGHIDIPSLIAGSPKINTTGMIPEAHIVFLDEIFKCNEGVLNALLTAFHERKYTNQGEIVNIPVISFMSATNPDEIPNFNNPEEKILRPLYDRLHLKIVTHDIQSREERLRMLKLKRSKANEEMTATITLDELRAMQAETASVIISEKIDELMDKILCELRRRGIHVSDRKFLNYYPIAQAQAWLNGRDFVTDADLIVLKYYFWTEVAEIATIEKVLEQFCVNPVQEQLKEITQMAGESYDEFKANVCTKPTKALMKLRGELLRLYATLTQTEASAFNTDGKAAVAKAIDNLEKISKTAHQKCSLTYAPLPELLALQGGHA